MTVLVLLRRIRQFLARLAAEEPEPGTPEPEPWLAALRLRG